MDRLLEQLDPAPSAEELEGLLYASKAELVERSASQLTLEATPDRLDLLSEEGLASYLQRARGRLRGLPEVRLRPRPPELMVDASTRVAPLRPIIAGMLLESPSGHALTQGLLEEAIRYQELLHATIGLDRRAASLGLYPAASLHYPLHYDLERAAGWEFQPLDGEAAIPVERFLNEHPLARKYGALGRVGEGCLTLRDARGTLLSLPPILNSGGAGRAHAGDRKLLLEGTGTRLPRVEEACALLSLPFLLQGWTATPIAVREANGTLRDGLVPLSTRQLTLPFGLVDQIGGRRYTREEIDLLLGRAGFGAEVAPEGWTVSAPAWRSDLLGAVDLVEDLIHLDGVRAEDAKAPPSRNRGGRLPSARLRQRLSALLLGSGFVLLHGTVLVPGNLMVQLGREDSVALTNPVSAEFARARDCLLPSLLGAASRNVRHGYPQKLAEVGPVLVPDRSAETGARTVDRAGFLLASDGAGFADAASLIEYLLRRLAMEGVREPARIPATIPGRGARVRIAGEVVAELGELHPALLEEARIPVPVVWAELDLSVALQLLGADSQEPR